MAVNEGTTDWKPTDGTRPNAEVTAAAFAARTLAAVAAAGRQAALENKRAGITMVEWREGRLVFVPPEEIRVSETLVDFHP
ncbi:MAG: hypothetical protein HQL64_11915 [Magnetococcales bacterium]|nr:hypothetical protein [Magnetococcales bacterium]